METFFNDLASQASAFFNTYPNLTYAVGGLLVLYFLIALFRGSAARNRVAAMKSENAQALTTLQTAVDGKVAAALKQLQAESASVARTAQEHASKFQQLTGEVQATRREATAAEESRATQVEEALGKMTQALEAAKTSIASEAQSIFNARAGSLLEASTAQGQAVERQVAALRVEYSDKLRALPTTTASSDKDQELTALTQRVDTLHKAIDEMGRALERLGSNTA